EPAADPPERWNSTLVHAEVELSAARARRAPLAPRLGPGIDVVSLEPAAAVGYGNAAPLDRSEASYQRFEILRHRPDAVLAQDEDPPVARIGDHHLAEDADGDSADGGVQPRRRVLVAATRGLSLLEKAEGGAIVPEVAEERAIQVQLLHLVPLLLHDVDVARGDDDAGGIGETIVAAVVSAKGAEQTEVGLPGDEFHPPVLQRGAVLRHHLGRDHEDVGLACGEALAQAEDDLVRAPLPPLGAPDRV